MIKYNYHWIIVGFVIFLNVCSSNYIYQKINTTLYDIRSIKFTVYILNSPGIILYKTDANQMKSVIEIEEIGGDNYFVVKSRAKMYSTKMNELCNLLNCSVNYLELEIEIKRDSITTLCNKGMKQFLGPMDDSTDDFSEYPQPTNSTASDYKRLHFWLGNIGPVEGFQSRTSKPKKEQLIGCLKEFYVKEKEKDNIIKFERVLSYFSSFCDNLYGNFEQPTKYLWNSSNLNCSFSTIEEQNQISNSRSSLDKIENDDLKRISSTENVTTLNLTWEHSSDDNYCLIQIKFRNHSVVIQVLQSYVHMVLFNNGEEYIRKILHKIWKDSINLLNISVKSRRLLGLKVTDKRFSTDFHLKIEEEFESMTIGFVDIKNICRTFSGRLNIEYDVSHFQEKEMKRDFNFYWEIIVPVSISVIIIIGVCIFILWRFLILKRAKRTVDGEVLHYCKENPVYDLTMEHG